MLVKPTLGAFEWVQLVQGIFQLNQPEAAEADKVSVCGVWSPHDWLFGKDQLAR